MKNTQKTLRKTRNEGEKGVNSCFDLSKRPPINENIRGLGIVSGMILAHLFYTKEPMQLTALQKLINTSLVNTYEICSRLVKHGFVDKHGSKYTLTASGRREMLILRSYLFLEDQPALNV